MKLNGSPGSQEGEGGTIYVRLCLHGQTPIQLQRIESASKSLRQHVDHVHLPTNQALILGATGIAGAREGRRADAWRAAVGRGR